VKNSNLLLLETQLATLLAGLRAKLPAGSYTVAGVVRTRDELVKTVEDALDLFASTREAHAAVRKLAHERDLGTPGVRILLQEIRSLLNTQFGMESPELLGFGFKPRNRRAAKSAAKSAEPKPAA
jgi:hypothetical protein